MKSTRLLKHALASLRADFGRTLAVVITFALAFSTVLLVIGFQRGVEQRLEAIFAAFMHPWEGGIGLVESPAAGHAKPDLLADRTRLRQALGSRAEFAAYGLADVDVAHLGAVRHMVMTAADPELWDIRGWQLAAGRTLTADDDAGAQRYCVVTESVARQIFGGAPAVGQELLINNTPFQIVGVRRDDDDAAAIVKTYNQSVLVPLHTAMERRMLDSDPAAIKFRAFGTSAASLAKQIAPVLREAHRLEPGAENDFTIATNNRMAETFRKGKANVIFLGWAIAGTATLLSGLMMANMMLLSVKQRRKEVGIRRALGATRKQVVSMFLVEAALMIAAGSIAGAGLAAAASSTVARLSKLPNGLPRYPIAYTPALLATSFVLLALVAIAFAALPARRAASIDPATAVR